MSFGPKPTPSPPTVTDPIPSTATVVSNRTLTPTIRTTKDPIQYPQIQSPSPVPWNRQSCTLQHRRCSRLVRAPACRTCTKGQRTYSADREYGPANREVTVGVSKGYPGVSGVSTHGIIGEGGADLLEGPRVLFGRHGDSFDCFE